MRVLITGGAGFIGGHLADRFLSEGFQVRVLDNLDPKIHPHGRPDYLSQQVEFIKGDVSDESTLYECLRDVDVVSHQAAYQDYMPDFARFFHVNTVSTAILYELIVRNRMKVKKVIVASSQAVYGEGQYQCSEHGSFLPPPRSREQLSDGNWEVCCPHCKKNARPILLSEDYTNPYNQYAVSKFAQEKAALGLGWLHGIPTVALRYSITQGARQSLFNHYSGVCRIFFSNALLGLPLVIYEDGCQTRDFVHIQDVVDANMLVLEADDANFNAFNVGSGKAITVKEYANAVLQRVQCTIAPKISGEYRRGDNRHSVSDVAKLRGLGWRPKRDLSTIMDDFVTWIESIGGIPGHIPDAYSEMREAGVVLNTTS
jgi:dTDP-L-rhamnose 4-epimerase